MDDTALAKRPRELGSSIHDRVSKADRIYAELKRAIIVGELSPATPIDKNDVCDRFGVSRFPVTTAINRLAYESLVVIEPQRGSFVAKIKLADMVEWFAARRALEADVAGECARRLTGENLERLARNMRYQEAAAAGGDIDGFYDLDIVFHRLMIEGLGLRRIGEMLEAIRAHVDRVRRLLLPEGGRMAGTLDEHRAIFAAIRQREATKAGRAMRAHVDNVLKSLLDLEKRRPDYFSD